MLLVCDTGEIFFVKYNSVYSFSIEEIRKAPSKICWDDIFNSQKLSEDFIREFENYLDWWQISIYQNLSKEFIIEFSDKVYFNNLLKNNNISDEIKEFCRIFV